MRKQNTQKHLEFHLLSSFTEKMTITINYESQLTIAITWACRCTTPRCLPPARGQNKINSSNNMKLHLYLLVGSALLLLLRGSCFPNIINTLNRSKSILRVWLQTNLCTREFHGFCTAKASASSSSSSRSRITVSHILKNTLFTFSFFWKD